MIPAPSTAVAKCWVSAKGWGRPVVGGEARREEELEAIARLKADKQLPGVTQTRAEDHREKKSGARVRSGRGEGVKSLEAEEEEGDGGGTERRWRLGAGSGSVVTCLRLKAEANNDRRRGMSRSLLI